MKLKFNLDMDLSQQICVLIQLQAAFKEFDLIEFFLNDTADLLDQTWLTAMCINPYNGIWTAVAEFRCMLNYVASQDQHYSPLTVFLPNNLFVHFIYLLDCLIDVCEDHESVQLLDIMADTIRLLNRNLARDLRSALRPHQFLVLYTNYPQLLAYL